MNSGKVVQWLIPTTLLVAFIVVMFMLFTAKVEQRGEEIVEENIVMTAEEYALRIHANLAEIESSVDCVIATLEQYNGVHNIRKNLTDNICKSTTAYMTVVVNREGDGISNKGTLVNLGGYPYFYHAKNGDHWFYTADDEITGKGALVYTASTEEGSHVLAYYDLNDIFKLIKLESYTDEAFYMLLNKDYDILISQGESENYLSDDNLKKTIDSDKANVTAGKGMNNDFKNTQKGSRVISIEGEVRNLCYAPVDMGDFFFLIGVENSYVVAEGRTYYSEATGMIMAMMIAIGVFFVLVIIINFIIKAVDKKQKGELQLKVDTDILTGLTNKAATERLIQEYIHANPNGIGVLFIIDVDNFKKINDTMGHAFGDEVLKELGHQIRGMFRATDVVGRFGGDEFVIFMQDVKDPNVIKRDADRLKDFFNNFKAGEYVKYSVTASIGASVYTEDGKDYETLFRMADKALYVVKRHGKNNLFFYSDVKDEADTQLIDYRGREE